MNKIVCNQIINTSPHAILWFSSIYFKDHRTGMFYMCFKNFSCRKDFTSKLIPKAAITFLSLEIDSYLDYGHLCCVFCSGA